MTAAHLSKRNGFTLVELTVSMAVLMLFMVTLVQVIGAVSNTWLAGAARVDNLTQARAVLGLLERDIQSMVLRPDVAAFVDENGAPACAFYSQVQGGDGDRKVSLVKYAVDSDASDDISGLARFDYGMNYDPAAASARKLTLSISDKLPDLGLAQQEEFAPGVIALGLQFVDRTGALQDRFFFNYKDKSDPANTRTLVVSLVVLDNAGYDLAVSRGKLAQLIGLFSVRPANSIPHARTWASQADGGQLLADFPDPVRAGIRVFEHSISVPCP